MLLCTRHPRPSRALFFMQNPSIIIHSGSNRVRVPEKKVYVSSNGIQKVPVSNPSRSRKRIRPGSSEKPFQSSRQQRDSRTVTEHQAVCDGGASRFLAMLYVLEKKGKKGRMFQYFHSAASRPPVSSQCFCCCCWCCAESINGLQIVKGGNGESCH